MQTVRDIILTLLRDLGVKSLDPSENSDNRGGPGLADDDVRTCLFHLNGAFQEIYDEAPGVFSQLQYNDVLRAPTNVTFTASAQYSKTISSFLTWASWMTGCTIRIAGEATDNVLLSATSLLRPIMGSAGAKTAVVYADAMALPSTFGRVVEPIFIPQLRGLIVAESMADFLTVATGDIVRTLHPTLPANFGGIGPKIIGPPTTVFIDSYRDTTSQYLPIFLRFAPMPDIAYEVEMTVKRKPPIYVASDVENGSDHTTDPNTLVPQDWVESVLVPVARQRMSSDANFANEEGKAEIARQYGAALRKLQGIQPAVSYRRGNYPRPAGVM